MTTTAGNTLQNADKWKAEALRIGFSACGIAHADAVDEKHTKKFQNWLHSGEHAEMSYMENHLDLRLDPRLLLPGAQSIIVVALNYYPQNTLGSSQYQFAYYAYGQDYHHVVKKRLQTLCSELKSDTFKICCDTVPMLDRYWAWKAGLGWIGKNTNLIIPQAGSFFFLGEIITLLKFDKYDQPIQSRCGQCEKCIHNCPTGALHYDDDKSSTVLNANKCLSYLTIENRRSIPTEAAEAMDNCIYGCDKCQLVCPHNLSAIPTEIDELRPSDEFMQMQPYEWNTLTQDRYRDLFRHSAVKRATYEGLVRNIQTIKKLDSSHEESS